MFAISKYTFSGLIETPDNNPYHPIPTAPTLCLWLILLFPSIRVEKLYPMSHSLLALGNHCCDSTITCRPDFQLFRARCLSLLSMHSISSVKYLTGVTPSNGMICQMARTIGTHPDRSLRFVTTELLSTESACETLCMQELFIYASLLKSFVAQWHQNGVSIKVFRNVNRIQLLLSIRAFQAVCSDVDDKCFLILPFTTNATQNSNLLLVPAVYERALLHFLVCEWAVDASSIRKHVMLVSPFIIQGFHNMNACSTYSTIKVLLRWLSVSRNQQRGILQPFQPGFELYQCLPTLLNLFDVRQQFRTCYAKTTIAKRLDNTRPHFLRGLKSFLQLKNPHFCLASFLKEVYEFLVASPSLQNEFPHVWDTVNQCNLEMSCIFPLNDLFVLGESQYPAFMFFYGMALSTKVPKKMRRRIWLELHTQDEIVLPGKMKGIEHYQRHLGVYKKYASFCVGQSSNHCSNLQQLLNLSMLLEHRILHNPSTKASLNVNNVPTILALSDGVDPPLLSTDRGESASHMSFVHSSCAWVVRGGCSFPVPRRYLLDEMILNSQYSYNILQ